MDYESDFKPRLLSKTRKNDQSICRKQSSGRFECPELKQEKVVMAIQRAQDPHPDFRKDEPLDGIAKSDWAQNFPALKIHSTGKLSRFINYS